MSDLHIITIDLVFDISIYPEQMNNKIVDNIKQNIKKKYAKRCYNGMYIEEIYDIKKENISQGYIDRLSSLGVSIHKVIAQCKVISLLKDVEITATIIGINNMLIIAENGPIKFIISNNYINNKNIIFKKSAYYPVINGTISETPLCDGCKVVLQIIDKKIVNGSTMITAMARLDRAV